MRILITGGAGFIGSNLAKFHLNKNDDVIVVDNLITGKKKNIEKILNHPNFKFIEKDIISFRFEEIPPVDVIYHLASPASPPYFKKLAIEILMVNSVGTKNVLDYVKRSKSKRFVFSSSSEVYGDPKIHPQPESYWGNVNPNGYRSCYDEAKRFGESLIMSYVRTFGLDCRIVRVFNTYGPYMDPKDGRVVSSFINQAIGNQPITVYGSGNQTRSFCFVDDMVQGIHLAGNTSGLSGKVMNIGNPTEFTVLEIAKKIKELTKSSSKIIFRSIPPDDPKRRKPVIKVAKKLLGWEPKISLDEGLKKTIQYYQNL